MIIGNDLRHLTVTGEGSAPIVLGQGSTHCVVVCPWKTDVLDKGVDNILLNANRLPWSPKAQATMKTMPLTQANPLGQMKPR